MPSYCNNFLVSLHLISYFSHINPSQHMSIIFPKHKSYCDISWFKSLLVAQQCTQSKHEPIRFTKFQTIIHVPILLLLSYPNPQSSLLKPNLCLLRTNHSKEHCTSKPVFLYTHCSFSLFGILHPPSLQNQLQCVISPMKPTLLPKVNIHGVEPAPQCIPCSL